MAEAQPERRDRGGRRGLRVALLVASGLFAAVVLAATGSHVVQLWRAIRTEAQERAGTLARILAQDVGRSFHNLQLQFDAVGDGVAELVASGRTEEANALLAGQTLHNGLVRELALVDAEGRVAASSRPASVGSEILDVVLAARRQPNQLTIGPPREGRNLAAGAPARDGLAAARAGHFTISRPVGAGPGAPTLVAVVGADSLVNEMHHLAGDGLAAVAVYRYDGRLVATDSESLVGPRPGNPIFRDFIPRREQGGFTEVMEDGARWMAHFDTADDQPVVVEVRQPEAVVVARWRRELVEPVAVLALILGAIALYVGFSMRSLRKLDESMDRVRAQERRLRNILDTAADGIVTIDERGVIREYNRAAEGIFRVPPAEAIGNPLVDLLPPELAGHQAYLEAYLATGKAGVIGHGRTMSTRRRDGSPIVVYLAVSEVVEAGHHYFTGIVRDVTAVQEAEQRFRALFQRSGEPHLLFDHTGLVDCNDAALALLGAPGHADVVGRQLADLGMATQGNAGDAAAAVAARAEAEARKEGVKRLQWNARRLDGTAVPVEMTLTPLRLADQHDALLVSWHDVAERQRYEDDLRRARDAAEAAAQAKASFLATMSHELRTPMTGIIGMIELLADAPASSEQRRFVDALEGSARSLLRVLNDVLDYSKIDAGKLELEEVDFDPRDVAQEVVDLLDHAASRQGNEVRTEWGGGELPRVRGDPTRLRQVLVNLVGNAVKFTERGTITVGVWAAHAAPGDPVTYRFEVRDTGVGIPAEVLPRLFQPFQQADGSTTRRFGGTGLGLAICRRLVDAMGGEIGVESEPGRGTTFWFKVRVRRAAPVSLPAPPESSPDPARTGAGSGPGLRILVAEDNAVNRLLIGTRLRRMNHVVTMVEDGRKAVDTVRGGGFDLVLMDMQMPELDGAGATREIRRMTGPEAHVPIVALTADALPEFREHYMASGLDDYLTKPVDWKALERVLHRYGRAEA